jgi:hypothetical protein
MKKSSFIKQISQCRICGNSNLIEVCNLGEQALTGVFPKSIDETVGGGPLELVKCTGDTGQTCGLVQLRHSYSLPELYGGNYGYRSGLNSSMVKHLRGLALDTLKKVSLRKGEVILDIGSNDGTLLSFFPKDDITLIGMDPTASKFKQYYQPHIRVLPDFFGVEKFRSVCGSKQAKVVTSISMFYDLESPLEFADEVREILADDGLWVFEQSYLPLMLKTNAYDTICHEHLEYYSLKQIKWITDQAGLKIVDVALNHVNGGSFRVTVAKSNSSFHENETEISKLSRDEEKLGLDTFAVWDIFRQKVFEHRLNLREHIERIKAQELTVFGYGASTKGNVILQYCGLTSSDIPCIAEINEDKFGCFTPGTKIPIVSEDQAKSLYPDYFLVLPWHFMENIVSREQEFLHQGGKLLFPLPEISIVENTKPNCLGKQC